MTDRAPTITPWRSPPMRRVLLTATSLAVMTAAAFPGVASAALETAAGGKGSGAGGFADFVNFLNNLATYLVYVGAAAGVLGIIASGGMLIAGSPEGGKWLVRTVLGVGIVLLAKGIMA